MIKTVNIPAVFGKQQLAVEKLKLTSFWKKVLPTTQIRNN